MRPDVGNRKAVLLYEESQPHVEDRIRMARGGAGCSLSRCHRHDNLAVRARPKARLPRGARDSWSKVLEPRRYRRVDATHGDQQGDSYRESRSRRFPLKWEAAVIDQSRVADGFLFATHRDRG